MSSNNFELLLTAISRNAGIVLSLPSAGLLRHHKSRFLAEAGDGFWVESVPTERPLVTELVGSGQPVGVSFKSAVTKVIFTVPIVRHEVAYEVNADTAAEALLLAYPTEVKAIQRRSNYRVPVSSELRVRVWRIADRDYLKEKPLASQLIKCAVRDISTGGLGVTFEGENGEPPRVSVDHRLRVELKVGDVELLVEGQMRKPSPSSNADPLTIRTGITFKHLENSLEGRQTLAALTRIVGTLQRDEARRHRMGTKTA